MGRGVGMSGRAGYPEFGMKALEGRKRVIERKRGREGERRRREEKRRGQPPRMEVKDVTAPQVSCKQPSVQVHCNLILKLI